MCSQCDDKSIYSLGICQKCWDKAHGIIGRIAFKSKIRNLYICVYCGLSTLRKDKECEREACVESRPSKPCVKCNIPGKYTWKGMCKNCINKTKKTYVMYSPIENTPESIIAYLATKTGDHD